MSDALEKPISPTIELCEEASGFPDFGSRGAFFLLTACWTGAVV